MSTETSANGALQNVTERLHRSNQLVLEDGEEVRAGMFGNRGRSIVSRIFGSALAVLAVAIAACGGDDGGVSTFERDGFPFTFQYPADFELSEDVSISQELGGGGVSGETLALALDDDNGIFLQSHTLNLPVDAGNLPVVRQEFDGLLAQANPGAEGEEGEIGGFPSLAYDAFELTTPEDGQSRLTFVFDGDQEYVINCQSTPDNRDEIAAACDQALETLAPTEDAA